MSRPASPPILSLVGVLLLAAASFAQDAEQLFQDGIDAFRRGDNSAAISAFKRALATNPADDEVYRVWQQAEQQVVREMLVEKGELGALAERFLQLARVGRQRIATDPGGASAVVERVLTGDALERERALLELQATYGEWAVPALVGPLGDRSDIDRRVGAMQALLRLGDHAVVPLLAVLESEDVTTRTNAAALLGSLRDPRAAAHLAWMAEADPSDTVRQMAARGVEKLAPELASMGITSTGPLVVTLSLARRWITGDPGIVKPYTTSRVAWRWDGGLEGTPMLAGLRPLLLAESALRAALGADAGDDARAALAAVHAAMKAEIQAAAEVDALQDDDLVDAATERLDELDLNLALAGAHRGGALRMLLENGQLEGAKVLTSAMGGSDHERRALSDALGHEDAGVAIAAALALGRLGDHGSEVVRRLGEALTAVPDRLVISLGDTGLGGDADGWELLTSHDVVSGLLRAKAFPPKDVVVVEDGLAGVTLDTMIFGLRNDPRTADVPIVVATPNVAEVRDLYGDEVAEVVERATWANVEEVAGDRNAVQREAMARARDAARVLASLPPDAVAGVGPSVAAALGSGADEEVEVAVLELAGRAGLTEATAAVERLVGSGAGSRELQIAGMNALARLWARAGGGQPDDALRGVLEEALASGDGALARAAAEALGQTSGVSRALSMR